MPDCNTAAGNVVAVSMLVVGMGILLRRYRWYRVYSRDGGGVGSDDGSSS